VALRHRASTLSFTITAVVAEAMKTRFRGVFFLREAKSKVMNFTFKQLEYFVAVADCGTITGAAEKIHVSAPSISVAIAQLEESLEIRLFTRQSSGLQLTTAGDEVRRRVRTILEETRGLQDISNTVTGELRGKISLGCLTTLAPLLLPEVCQTFSRIHPAVSVEPIDGSQDQLIGYLRRAVIDLVITYDMHIPQDLWFESLVGRHPLIMLSPDHRLAQAPSVEMKDLESDPYILLDLPISRDYFLSIFEKTGITPDIKMRTTNFDVVRTMVANGYGVSISVVHPKNEAALDGKPIIYKPISNPLPLLNIGTLSRRTDFTSIATSLKRHIQSLITSSAIPGMRLIDHHQVPTFGISTQGFRGGKGLPFCNSSTEIPSGDRTNAI